MLDDNEEKNKDKEAESNHDHALFPVQIRDPYGHQGNGSALPLEARQGDETQEVSSCSI